MDAEGACLLERWSFASAAGRRLAPSSQRACERDATSEHDATSRGRPRIGRRGLIVDHGVPSERAGRIVVGGMFRAFWNVFIEASFASPERQRKLDPRAEKLDIYR